MVAHCNYSYTLEQEAKMDHLSNIYYGICVQKDTTFQGPENLIRNRTMPLTTLKFC